MGRLGNLSKRREKHSGIAPFWSVVAGGTDLTDNLKSITGGFETSGGSSFTLELNTSDLDLDTFADEMVKLRLGYGRESREYMAGRLAEPYQPPFGGMPKATAYGPFAEWGTQSVGEDTDFTGRTVEEMLYELGSRAAMGRGSLIVQGGSVRIEEGETAMEASLLEAATGATDALGFITSDLPGYRRLVMPKPYPGSGTKTKDTYVEGDYAEGGFNATRQNAVRYDRVVVFRRDENGNYPVRESAPVANRGGGRVPKNRIYWIPEFTGNSTQAKLLARREAGRLSRGAFDFTFSCSINPDLEPYDVISVTTTQRIGRHICNVVYRCQIEKIGLDVKEDSFNMGLDGVALRQEVVPIRFQSFRSVRSTGLVSAA